MKINGLLRANKSLAIAALLLSLGLSALNPHRADAAMIIGGQTPSKTGAYIEAGAFHFGLVAVLSPLHMDLLAIGLGVLDADGSLAQDQIQEVFTNHYPFIDNPEVLAKLSSAVKETYARGHDHDGFTTVRLNSNEIRSILAPADLTEEQISKVVNDLK